MENCCEKCKKKAACDYSFNNVVKDSFIEEIFWENSLKSPTTQKLLWEWIDSKNVYTKFSGLSRKDFEHYSKHDESHSIAILNVITAIIGKERISSLGATDLWLLLHCAYGHDIGMHVPYAEVLDLWKNMKKGTSFYDFFESCLLSDDLDLKKAACCINDCSKKIGVEINSVFDPEFSSEELDTGWVAEIHRNCSYLTSEFIRRDHAKRSHHFRLEQCEMMEQYGTPAVDPRYYKIIAKCFALHGCSLEEVLELQEHELDLDMGKCHPRFAALMLRLGDLLDISSDRIDRIDYYHYGQLPELSELHKKKHSSIEHILLNKQDIVLVARSNEEKVCALVDEWFQMIQKEVQFLIFHWTDFAPKCLGGCMLKKPELQVYLGEEAFRNSSDKKFKLDKDILIDLLIGKNLYQSRLDFLREYLQNAMDASKMKFWLDYSNHNLDYFLIPGKTVRRKKEREILPFDFQAGVFEQYRIEITYYLEKKEKPGEIQVHLEIEDRGIGIDAQCVEAISNIGSGWKKRKHYAKELLLMPKWLSPTGGFGIGMQSAFMITEKICIETKCDFEPIGRQIFLYSEKDNGRIEVRDSRAERIGTRISVDIPFVWFLDPDNYGNWEGVKKVEAGQDFFDPDSFINVIGNYIYFYIKKIAKKSLFPIIVRERGMNPTEKCGRKWEHIESVNEDYLWKNRQYKVGYIPPAGDNEVPKFHLWDMENQVYCEIEINDSSVADQKGRIDWYYKGIYVDSLEYNENEQQNHLVLSWYLGTFCIDIMGIPVKDCLTVDRSRFKEEFNYMELADTYAIICIEYLAKKKKLLARDRPTIAQLMRSLIAFAYLNDFIQAEIRETFDKLPEDNIANQKPDMMLYTYTLENVLDESEKQELSVQTDRHGVNISESAALSPLLVLCRNLYMTRTVNWAFMGKPEKLNVAETYSGKADVLWVIGEFPGNTMRLLPALMQKLYSGKVLDDKGIEIHYYNRNQEEREEKERRERSSIERIMKEAEGEQVYFVPDDMYPELHVTKIPVNAAIDSVRKEQNMILSPIPQKFRMVKEMVALNRSEEPETAYVELITNESRFDLLVHWVYKYAKNKGNDISIIRQKNIELIRKYYEVCMKENSEEE